MFRKHRLARRAACWLGGCPQNRPLLKSRPDLRSHLSSYAFPYSTRIVLLSDRRAFSYAGTISSDSSSLTMSMFSHIRRKAVVKSEVCWHRESNGLVDPTQVLIMTFGLYPPPLIFSILSK